MAYVLTDGGFGVVTYPYNIGMLRRDNPNVSFPANPTNEQLAEWNVYLVTPTTAPSFDVIGENLSEVSPVKTEMAWVQQWSVTAATAEEIASRTAYYEGEANAEAARLLAETDGYLNIALDDGVGLHDDLIAYRGALRDPSTLSGYPVAPVWPTLPTSIYDSAKKLPFNAYTKTQTDDAISDAVSSRVSVYGSTMEGEIDMNTYAIKGVGNPIAGTDAANKDYVDTAISGIGGGDFLPLTGGTMSGEIDMGFQKIVGLADPEWPQDAVNKQYADGLASSVAELYLPLSGGTVNGDINVVGQVSLLLGNDPPTPKDPIEDYHATPKSYVDAEIAAAVAPLAILPRLTLNLQTSTGSITTSPVIADALSSIGTTNGYTINLGFGEYRETGPIVVNEKWQLQINGNRTAGTTSATIKNGLTIQNSNGVRLHTVQVEGVSSIACRAGLGIYAERSQFMGNVTLSGTGGFMFFIDCDFGGNVTISNTFAGTVYFVRCQFSNASGVYTFSQTSPLQAIISDCGGIPNTSIANASYSGLMTYKAGTQAYFVNGLPLYYSGTTAMRPSTATTGFMFFDTTLNKPIWRSGSTWRDATGASV